MNDGLMDVVLGHLNKALVELDVPEHEITKLMANLEKNS
jgi:hypothetical protein